MTWLVPIVLGIFAAYAMVVIPRTGFVTVDTIFASSQTLMTIGTLILIDDTSPVELRYGWIMSGATTLYMLSSCLYSFALSLSSRIPVSFNIVEVRSGPGLKTTLAVSFTIVVAYFVSVGYSAFFLGLSGIFSGAEPDVTTLRLESYSGTRYLYPGYVNQFKNVVIPALLTLLISSAFSTRGRSANLYAVVLALTAAACLLATGQRDALVLFIVVVLCYMYLRARGTADRHYFTRSLYILLGAIPLLMLGTLVLGRQANSSAAGTLGQSGALLAEIGERFLFGNQFSGIAGYRYTESLPVSNGNDWLQGLLGFLPGNRGSTLSSEIFRSLYGGTRGTSPPSLWGSIDYNFGFVGVVVAPILLAIALQIVASTVLHRTSYSALELIGMAGMRSMAKPLARVSPTRMSHRGSTGCLMRSDTE